MNNYMFKMRISTLDQPSPDSIHYIKHCVTMAPREWLTNTDWRCSSKHPLKCTETSMALPELHI